MQLRNIKKKNKYKNLINIELDRPKTILKKSITINSQSIYNNKFSNKSKESSVTVILPIGILKENKPLSSKKRSYKKRKSIQNINIQVSIQLLNQDC